MQPNPAGQLDWLLDDLVMRVAPITKAVILSQDGIALGASRTLARLGDVLLTLDAPGDDITIPGYAIA